MTGTVAIIVAAGRGMRMGDAANAPKQYRMIAGRSILAHAMEPFLAHQGVDAVLPVLHPDDSGLYAERAPQHAKVLSPVLGGAMRQDSVRRGLEALVALGPERVLIHDGVRPFVSGALIGRVLEALERSEAVLPALPVTDTIKMVDAAGRVERTVPREALRSVQTPQGFRFHAILHGHRHAAALGKTALTDDAAVAEVVGLMVGTVMGEQGNMKITTVEDLVEAERRMGGGQALEVRVGQGFDVHAFTDGDHVMLGGVKVPHGRGLLGHSDADVGLHALTDAILGALADGDIGRHFPPSEEAWKGASSDRFLKFAAERVRARGGTIDLLDLTIICEAPKIGPHAEAMRRKIGEIAGIGVERVSVKATTTERLGFAGRKEGIAALATATVRVS